MEEIDIFKGTRPKEIEDAFDPLTGKGYYRINRLKKPKINEFNAMAFKYAYKGAKDDLLDFAPTEEADKYFDSEELAKIFG